MSAIKLYYMPESPPCRAVQMVAAQIGVPLDLQYVDLSTGQQLSPEFGQMNPHRVVPTIVDQDFVLWESRAILKYLVDQHASDSPLYPRHVRQRAKIDQILDFDIGSLYASQGLFLRPLLQGRPSDPEGEEKFRKSLSLLEDMLSDGCVCGADVTIADISLVASLSFADAARFDFSVWPRICRWKQDLRQKIVNYSAINDKAMERFTGYMSLKTSQPAAQATDSQTTTLSQT